MRRLILLMTLLASVFPLAAQTDRATLTGVAMDSSRSVIPNATITLLSATTGVQHIAKTNSAGVYTLSALPIGRYTATVAAPGFETEQVQSFTLQVGETRTLNATLSVGAVQSAVTVVAATADLSLAKAEVGGVIDATQTAKLPVNGRYWATLMALIPGSLSSGTGTQDTIRFSGLSQEDNNFRFDGVDASGINHQFLKDALRLQIPMESIAEFKSSSAVYSADVGGMAGGQVSMVSKSGGNDFHGSIYEYLRNSFFDAAAWNAPSGVAPFKLNNFGTSVGGPIIRNKLFFFANYEGIRQAFSTALTGYVPTDAYRQSAIQKSPSLAPIVNAFPEGRKAVAGDPNAMIWNVAASNPTNEDGGLGRLDYALSEKTAVSLRFNTDSYITTAPGLAESTITTVSTPNTVIDVQHRITPTILNDSRIGFNRDAYQDVGQGSQLPYSVTISPNFSYSLGDHSFRMDNSFSFIDDATFTQGRHTFKAGGEIRHMQENKRHSAPIIGLSYLSETNFLNNVLDSYSNSNSSYIVETGARKTPMFAYGLDEFKIRPNLTVNVGLRYEYYGVDTETNKNTGQVFDPFTCGLQLCPKGSPFYYPNYHDFEPKVSIAWAPEAMHNKTAIRAGFSTVYDDGQFGGLYAGGNTNNVIGASNFSLSQKNNPGLTFPITPFLGAAAASSVTYSANDQHRKDLNVNQWTLSVQQELLRDTILQVAYVGSKGTHLFQKGLLLNLINPLTGKRPFASLTSANVNWTTDDANSTYNALQVGLKRNMARGLLFSANYQYSHGISDGSNGGGESDTPENMACRSCERASTDFDIRHNFTTSAIWNLPVGKGHTLLADSSRLTNALLGGWQLSGIGSARTGVPLNVTMSRSASALPDGNNGSQRPDRVPGQPLYASHKEAGTSGYWLNPYAFTTPANGTWGNASRNAVRAPGLWQTDLGMEKKFTLTERAGLSFRSDVFNVFNRAQYGSPNAKWTDPSACKAGQIAPCTTFGQIITPYTSNAVGSGTPRQMQFSLRLTY